MITESWDAVMTGLRGRRLALLDDAHRGYLYGIPADRQAEGAWLLRRYFLRAVSPGVYRARATTEAAAMYEANPVAPEPVLTIVQAATPEAPVAINSPAREIRVHEHQLAFFD